MIQGLAAIPYVGAVALGTAIGINTTGKSVLEISNAITKKIQENPEIINTPQFKGLAFAMGLRVPGVIAPDAAEMEREKKRIEDLEKERLKGTPPPKIDLTEEFPLPENELLPRLPGFGEGEKPDVPLTTGGSEVPELKIPIITFSKDVPKDLKGLVKRSVGKDKGTKAVEAIFDDDIFSDVLDGDQVRKIRRLEDQYVGDIMDKGDPSVPIMFTNSMFSNYEDYFEDYKDKLAEVAREKLGNEFSMFRLMNKEDALKMLKDQQLPDIKIQNEEGDMVPFTIDVIGEETAMSQENMSFSLNPRTALDFKQIFHSDKPDEDYVLLEYKASPTDIVMRGHMSEEDLVLNMGEAVGSPSSFKVYDFKFVKDGDKIKGLNVSVNKEFDEFVKVKKADGGIVELLKL
jgi:hypothetical protein